ncbi:MAG TPA: FecR domain-containing protein [Syntrophorhabdaceae bacterium]|nr:FecR domain-containing protein [Syntrophorhabdaceae bacterium]
MKRSNVLKAGMLAGLLLFVAVHAFAADPDTLYVRYIEGAVELAEAGSSQWTGAAVNTPLIEGDTIRTAATGRAELLMKDGSLVRIGKGSTMKIIAVEQNGVQFKLDRGMAYINAKGSKEVPIFFDTSSAALDIATPATLRIDAYDDGTSEISVYKGTVYAAQQKGKMPVKAGERIVLRADGSAPVLAGLRGADEWQRWNTDRDGSTSAGYGESNAYLPEELRTYSSDFDTNGQWVYTDEYSYVWVPTVITVGTWSPYRTGRWAWIRGSYVWIGYEPWGWAPYHYGRWAYHRHAGWCWVPPARGHVRWEPAHVAWVHSSKHVGWVPLAPGEAYDRRKAPVINQTNIYNIYNNVTVAKSVSTARTAYKNAGVANSMVTVERDRLLRQKAVTVNVAKNGPVSMKKVSLPANVVPARTRAAAPQAFDRSKIPQGQAVTGQKPAGQPGTNGTIAKTSPGTVQKVDEKRPALQRPAAASTQGQGIGTPGAASGKVKDPSVPARRATVTPDNRMAVKEKDVPVNVQTPKAAVSLKDRIDNARNTDVKTGQQGVQARNVPNTPVVRRIDEGKKQGQGTSKPVPPTPAAVRVEEKRLPNTPNVNNNAAVGTAGPQGAAIQQRPPVAATGPVRGSVPVNSTVSVPAPARTTAVQQKPAVVTTRPAQNPQPPAQTFKAPAQSRPAQTVKVPEQPRQAPQRIEAKPVDVRRETPVQKKVEMVKQSLPAATVSSPAPQAPVSPANKGAGAGSAKPPEAGKDGKPQLQQNAARR